MIRNVNNSSQKIFVHMDEETTNRLLLLEFISALVKLVRPSVAMNLNNKNLVLLITKIRYSSFVMQIWSHASEVWAGRVVSITYMIISLVTNRISALYRRNGTRWIYYFLQTVSFMVAIIFEKLFWVGVTCVPSLFEHPNLYS